MILKPIRTTNQLLTVKGKVIYNDHRRRIDVKKPIRDLFASDSDANVSYVMELCLSEEKLASRIKELSEKRILPVLMYFTEEELENA